MVRRYIVIGLVLAGVLLAATVVNGFRDLVSLSGPGNPASGFMRLYANSANGLLGCLTSSGGNCLLPSAAVTNYLSYPGGGVQLCVGCIGLAGATKVSKQLYCSLINTYNTGNIGHLSVWLRTGLGAGEGLNLSIYTAAQTLVTSTTLAAASGQPKTLVVASTPVVIGGQYILCGTIEGTTGEFFKALDSDQSTLSANVGDGLFFLATNPATSSGSFLTPPATLGGLTKATTSVTTIWIQATN